MKDCKFLIFDNLDKKNIYERTDNACEIFHHKLNSLIEIKHPIISYYVENIKIYTNLMFILIFLFSLKNFIKNINCL